MPNLTHAQIANLAWEKLNDVPSNISGTVMNNIVDQARIFTNNYTKASIGSNAIPETYQTVIINLTTAWTLARMEMLGADFSWSLGEFRVDKGGFSSNAELVQSYFDQAIMELKFVGRPILFSKSNG